MTQKRGTLVVMRHGQTDYNASRRITGRADAQLTPEGEAQAAEIGLLIKHITFDKAYSSPLSRAFNTAAMALKSAGQDIPVHQREEITETDAGRFTGRSLDTDPELSVFRRTYGVPMPGGESDKDTVARVQKLFDAEILPLLAKGENVLIVCHSGTMHAFDIVLGLMETPKDDEFFVTKRVPNASPLVCEYEGGKLSKHFYIENPKAANQNRPPAGKKLRPDL